MNTVYIVGSNILEEGKLKEGIFSENGFIVVETPYGLFKLSGMKVDKLEQPEVPEVGPDSEEYWGLNCQGLVGIPSEQDSVRDGMGYPEQENLNEYYF